MTASMRELIRALAAACGSDEILAATLRSVPGLDPDISAELARILLEGTDNRSVARLVAVADRTGTMAGLVALSDHVGDAAIMRLAVYETFIRHSVTRTLGRTA